MRSILVKFDWLWNDTAMKPFLFLQLRPLDEVSDNEFFTAVEMSGLPASDFVRVRMDQGELPELNLDDYSGMIVGGGPSNACDPIEKQREEQLIFTPWLLKLLDEIVERDFPYLGICYGLGILVNHQGGRVGKERYAESVEALDIIINEEGQKDPILEGLPTSFRAMAGHKESIQEVPDSATILASSELCPVHILRVKNNIYATQFHPELEAVGLEIRVKAYLHLGYFPAEEGDELVRKAYTEKITVPPQILERFVTRYGTS
jgi:GMP synthase (glutamine-hydrolysing)